MRLMSSLLLAALVLTGCGASEKPPSASKNTNSLSSTPKPSKAAATGTWSVVGVAHNDKLNVRKAPNAGAAVLTRLGPTATRIKATGKRQGQWWQLSTAQGQGWANSRYLGQLGKPVDITAEAREIGIAPTAAALVRKVVRSQAAMGEGELRGPVTAARSSGQFTVDVLGYADDAIAGERFIVRTFPGEAGFQVRSASATPICARAVTKEGLCN